MTDGHSEGSTATGSARGLNWLIGGAISGVVGSAAFGALLWTIDPSYVVDLPQLVGMESSSTVGWALHLVTGIGLGVVFGLIVTRGPVIGTLAADVETDFIAAMGLGVRLALAGMVYGLAIWTLLSVVGLSLWASAMGVTDPIFPGLASESLLGHLLYGLLLGALFSAFVETAPRAEEAEAPFEEASR